MAYRKDINVRKRAEQNGVPEVIRPVGELSEIEIEEIRKAYANGCRGEILIGLRGEKRVITMLLPEQPENETSDVPRNKCLAILNEMGCNRCVRIFNITNEFGP